MIFNSLEQALRADPKKKGVELFVVCYRARQMYAWARAKTEAIGKVATCWGCLAHKYRAGVQIENALEAPTIQEG